MARKRPREAAHRSGRDEARTSAAGLPRTVLVAGALLVLLAIVPYLPAVRGPFMWDDVAVIGNPVVLQPDGVIQAWIRPWHNIQEEHYWPLTYTTFWLEYRLWGGAPAGYHIVNMLLHALNCLLLWRVLIRIRVPGPWLCAALFAVHPVHVESVAWIIERKDVLSGAFYLGAALVFFRAPVVTGRTLLLTTALFILGMLSKSIVVTLPVALLLGLFWREGRITRRDAAIVAPLLLVALLAAAFGMWFLGLQGAYYESGLSFAQRVVLAGKTMAFYLRRIAWPADFMAIYPCWDTAGFGGAAWAYPAALAALVAALVAARPRIGNGPVTALAYHAVTLSPLLGFIDFGYMKYSFVADRFQYLASIGPLTLLAGGATWLTARAGGGADEREVSPKSDLAVWRSRPVAAACVVAVIAACAAFTWRHAAYYANPEALWRRTIRLNPASFEAHHKLATELATQDRLDEAIRADLESLRLNPRYASAHNNVGVALYKQGKFAEAVPHFRKAIEIEPAFADPYNMLGAILAQQGHKQEAIRLFQKAVELNPHFEEARDNLRTAMGHAR